MTTVVEEEQSQTKNRQRGIHLRHRGRQYVSFSITVEPETLTLIDQICRDLSLKLGVDVSRAWLFRQSMNEKLQRDGYVIKGGEKKA
jgi:hypothetical protein